MIVAICVLSAAFVAVAVLWYRSMSHSLLAAHTRQEVIVTLKTEEAFRGVLYAVAPDAIALRSTTALAVGPTSEHHLVDGEVMILRTDIAYLQFA